MVTKLDAVLVGCGGMGNNWARILSQRSDIDIVGLLDINPGVSERLKANVELDVVP